MKRQTSLLIAAFILAVLLTAPAAHAASGATDAIRQKVDEVLSIMKNPAMRNPSTRPALLQDVEDRIMQIFDFGEFSARTVGPNWRSFSQDQKDRFEDAFASLLRATYIDKLDGYDGERVNYVDEITNQAGDRAEVQTTVAMKDKTIPVAYRLMRKGGGWKVYDVSIERVSLIENYRGQFRQLLLNGDPDALITQVQAKAADMRRQNQTAK